MVVALSLAIGLWMMAGSKEAFGPHVRPKGLPKCTYEPRISVMYHQQRHSIVLDDCIEKMAGYLPYTKLGSTQETRSEPS